MYVFRNLETGMWDARTESEELVSIAVLDAHEIIELDMTLEEYNTVVGDDEEVYSDSTDVKVNRGHGKPEFVGARKQKR